MRVVIKPQRANMLLCNPRVFRESTLLDKRNDDDATRATASLPGLDIEVTHRRSPVAEHISIHLQATPSFEAFGRFLESANPFAFWVEATRLAWLPFLPWLDAARALVPPGGAGDTPAKLPKV
jgi:hypothetical protein